MAEGGLEDLDMTERNREEWQRGYDTMNDEEVIEEFDRLDGDTSDPEVAAWFTYIERIAHERRLRVETSLTEPDPDYNSMTDEELGNEFNKLSIRESELSDNEKRLINIIERIMRERKRGGVPSTFDADRHFGEADFDRSDVKLENYLGFRPIEIDGPSSLKLIKGLKRKIIHGVGNGWLFNNKVVLVTRGKNIKKGEYVET